MSTTLETPISSIESNRRRVGALKSLGVVSVGDALTYYPFRVTDPVPARSLHEAKIGEKMAFAAHVLETRVFPMARRGFRLIATVTDDDFAARRNTPNRWRRWSSFRIANRMLTGCSANCTRERCSSSQASQACTTIVCNSRIPTCSPSIPCNRSRKTGNGTTVSAILRIRLSAI